jgi:hypothetical protein
LLARGIVLPGMKSSQAKPESKPEATKPAPEAGPSVQGPSDAELDRAMAVMERLWRRLVEMVQRVQKELSPPI